MAGQARGSVWPLSAQGRSALSFSQVPNSVHLPLRPRPPVAWSTPSCVPDSAALAWSLLHPPHLTAKSTLLSPGGWGAALSQGGSPLYLSLRLRVASSDLPRLCPEHRPWLPRLQVQAVKLTPSLSAGLTCHNMQEGGPHCSATPFGTSDTAGDKPAPLAPPNPHTCPDTLP